MLGDLHVHTRYSDGSATPAEALSEARGRGIGFISFVDHDTVEGTREALDLANSHGVEVIPGIEISAFDHARNRKVHLLGYSYRLPAANIRALCDPLLAARSAMTVSQAETLANAGYDISVEEIKSEAGASTALYKQHLMSVLTKKGLADGLHGTTYRTLFKNGGICDREIEYADVFDALRAIQADGGFAVLAHPGQLDSWEVMEELIEEGLDGIEIYHGDHSSEDHRRIREVQKRVPRLILTGGSDWHGYYGPELPIGEIRAPFGVERELRKTPGLPYAFIEGAMRRAGATLREATAGEVAVDLKDGDHRNLVTSHDLRVQEYLIDEIRSRHPDHAILAEEDMGETPYSDSLWIIDPIDGTTNFASAGRDFTISVAFYERGEPLLGFVYDVGRDAFYSGQKGKGAWRNGAPLRRRTGRMEARNAIVDMSFDSARIFHERFGVDPVNALALFRGHRALGCASLAMCRIAAGELDAYISAKVGIWDYAASGVILGEAGGCFRTFPQDAPTDKGARLLIAAGDHGLLVRLDETLHCRVV